MSGQNQSQREPKQTNKARTTSDAHAAWTYNSLDGPKANYMKEPPGSTHRLHLSLDCDRDTHSTECARGLIPLLHVFILSLYFLTNYPQ